MSQMAKNFLTYDITHKKPKTPKFFFIADLKTCQVFRGFQQLSSTIDRGAMPLLRQVKLLDFRLISKYECIVPWQQTLK